MRRVIPCLAGAATILATVAFLTERRTTEPQSQLAASPRETLSADWIALSELDFGEASAQPAFPWRLTLHNVTSHPLILRDVNSGCTCTAIRPRAAAISPGESCELQLSLNLLATENVRSSRDFAVDLTFDFGEEIPRVATLRGHVISSPIDLNWQSLDFGEIANTDVDSYERTIPLELSGDTALSVTCSSPEHRITLLRPAIDKDRAELHVALARSLPLSRFEIPVVLRVPDTSGAASRGLVLSVRGEIVPDVEAVPRVLQVGGQTAGTRISRDVTFQSRTGRRICSMSANELPPGFEVETLSQEDWRSRLVVARITWEAAMPGDQSVSLGFECEVDGVGAPVTTVVPVKWFGLIPNESRETQ